MYNDWIHFNNYKVSNIRRLLIEILEPVKDKRRNGIKKTKFVTDNAFLLL